jgi:hypothetical protein
MYRAPKLSNNSFRFDEKKRTEEKTLQLMEFPELSKKKSSASLGVVQTCYLDAISKEKETEEIKRELEEGWVRLSWDENTGKMVIEKKEKERKNCRIELSYHENVCIGMNKMFARWDEYKQKYIELYGEDAYPQMSDVFYYDTTDEDNDYLYDDTTDPCDDEG